MNIQLAQYTINDIMTLAEKRAQVLQIKPDERAKIWREIDELSLKIAYDVQAAVEGKMAG